MTGFVMFLHALICVGLVTVVLLQSGRGGGLTEAFSSAENILGAQTNSFMIKATAVFATLYFITCLSLAVMSAKEKRSLLDGVIPEPTQTIDLTKPSVEADKAVDEAVKAVEKAKEEVPVSAVAETK